MDQEPRLSAKLGATPGAVVKMCCALISEGKGEQALAILRKVMADDPDNPELASAERLILSHHVPSWHGPMLADDARNSAFAESIARSVAPGSTVLDIGTGSGLLAMMAARAGAAKVIACEANPLLAATAREIVRANGLGDVVEVIGRRSTELDRQNDLGGGADLVIAEVFSDDLLNELALDTMRHAAAHLARPEARFIPAAASVRVALAYRKLATRDLTVQGFDLSLFSRHLPPVRKLRSHDEKLEIVSSPEDLFQFEFGAPGQPASGRNQFELSAVGGQANGVAQWLHLQLDESLAYENRPGTGAPSHWSVLFHPFGPGRTVGRGDSITIYGAHDGERLHIWI